MYHSSSTTDLPLRTLLLLSLVLPSCMAIKNLSSMPHPPSLNFMSFNASCPVLCSGQIFDLVQKFDVYEDHKQFVDMSLRLSEGEVLADYEEWLGNGTVVTEEALRFFLEEYFHPPGKDLQVFEPRDFVESPGILKKIYDRDIRLWLGELNHFWKDLFRRVSDDVQNNNERYSMFPLPREFVIPGGRYREIYYWDTYWILEGLLLCEMKSSARGIIENFLFIVKTLGYVPNGTRKYYIGRSQLPMLIPMVDLYYMYTEDTSILAESIVLLEREFQFWVNNRSVDVTVDGLNHTLFRFNVDSDEPRTESYLVDEALYQDVKEEDKPDFYSNMRSGAESGWDYSSRWFVTEDGRRSESILDIKTKTIAPVDLNCMMAKNALLLGKFNQILQNDTAANFYFDFAIRMNKTISRVFWDEEAGFWFDFHLTTNSRLNGDFYASGFFPLWTHTYGTELSRTHIMERVVEYLKTHKVLEYQGGLPTSLINSSQQWDLPNGWAPLQHVAIIGLKEAAPYNDEVEDIARDLARKWLINNYYTYYNSSPPAMMEKYDVESVGTTAGGGFYNVQIGFGWSNGVAFRLASMYPHTPYIKERSHLVAIIVGVCVVIIMVVTLVAHFGNKKKACSRSKYGGKARYMRQSSANESEDVQLTDSLEFTDY